jgi:Homing endonuclease associated repeat
VATYLVGMKRATRGYWTRDRIVRALQLDARRRGRPPQTTDWESAHGRHWWPQVQTVLHEFDSWRAALQCAGLDPDSHCQNGHPLGDDGWYVWPSGKRECRTCLRVARGRSRARKRKTGECAHCGERAAPGRRNCPRCLAADRERKRAERQAG